MAAERQHDGGTELGRFLRARRTQLTPAEVGFTPGAGVRRTPGLRREEVAALAGVSIDYYTRLERGKETRPSLAVADALGRALKLDQDESEHLRDLVVRAARHAPDPPVAPSRAVSPQVRLLLENLRPSPAYVTSRTLDLLAHNPGALALYAGIQDWPASRRNLARFLFLHPAAQDLHADWDTQVRACVARLRALAGTDPDAPDLAPLIGELLLKSPDFAKLWDHYQVTRRTHGQRPKTFRHPLVGEITLDFQGMQLEGTPGHRLGVFVTTPGTPEHDAVTLLDMTAPEQDPAKRTARHEGRPSRGHPDSG
ncbi:helix-turn-helix transcriptional regulator [Streptacidiphilus sp. P02-A3a]|uniref:helix-turn-helix transcriptional regulator n=1 Tax=Streptacidiphilus sp. P02-A3a TaxID=2704468 RepID=UPI0015FE3897|nr:helix-turn-helix transcriptional regulator [Streptacidiphilus sp. P02-A3a]QMU69722.1 helix-turn-helix domain-containing protein [Streptacidiphilus sp. P02-A3a]